jgi:hypothetical protein
MIKLTKSGWLLLAAIMLSIPAYAASEEAASIVNLKPCGNYGRLYDVKTVETFQGTIAKIEKIACRRAGMYSMSLLVQQDKESIPVYLGPGWYVEKPNVKLAEGDKVQVVGSRVTIKKGPIILAKEIKKGEQVLRLRSDKGFPLWAGAMKRGMIP